jgi:5-methylcytosine-specific restriction protein B
MSYCAEVIRFINQAQTMSQSVKGYLAEHMGLTVRVSFGKGNRAQVPWIAFLKDNHTVRDGIYPAFLYYRELGLLILAYGTSESSTLNSWAIANPMTLKQYFLDNHLGEPIKYGNCFFFRKYDPNNIECKDLDDDLKEIIELYRNQ